MPVLIDGTVPLCREELTALAALAGLKEQDGEEKQIAAECRSLGNVFTDSLENIWQNGERYYIEQCKKNYTGICKNCDEYYTFNF